MVKPTSRINDLGAAVKAQKVSWDVEKLRSLCFSASEWNDSVRPNEFQLWVKTLGKP